MTGPAGCAFPRAQPDIPRTIPARHVVHTSRGRAATTTTQKETAHMSTVQWILAVWITVNALILFGKSCAGLTYTYRMRDGIYGLIESALAIWLLVSL